MPFIKRSAPGAMPTGFGDDDPTIGMGFSIFITVCSLAGLIFCFRRASTLIPRNLTIPLQMFGGQGSSSNSTQRGPIALSDDDLEGATGIDWEELDAQLEDVHGEDGEEMLVAEGEGGGVGGRLLKPVTRQARYLDDDEEEEEGQGQNVGYKTTEAEEEDDDAPFVDDDEDLEAEAVQSEGLKKDRLFKLDDEESEQEN
ncbi:hypothetical protein BGX29_012173 [Mortierella sp. GBA35]|nr:hypothetical protein BGX29_012173 [Mortierella sp. GBA35]